ncbi:sporulation protein YjcZ [Salipaludibacillus neizhouensis]|uniref:Sporulation protein YjcZ n=1 Tax=Salipaludibacillus neizhouensis TaxID=885475 RepID=A0A3A9K7Z7_9BACI|nr:YjcZ family sporulation protein [Salipaludibacillus neizhouensis]RKL66950.1 sporulation protein YjcZ [Salipaludibacillus neizhouensis]
MGFGGYGYGGAPWCPTPAVAPAVAPARGNGFALIVVLFILLIIVGAAACK